MIPSSHKPSSLHHYSKHKQVMPQDLCLSWHPRVEWTSPGCPLHWLPSNKDWRLTFWLNTLHYAVSTHCTFVSHYATCFKCKSTNTFPTSHKRSPSQESWIACLPVYISSCLLDRIHCDVLPLYNSWAFLSLGSLGICLSCVWSIFEIASVFVPFIPVVVDPFLNILQWTCLASDAPVYW